MRTGRFNRPAVETRKHRWLLKMQDRFSKWVKLSPLRRVTGPAITKTVRDHIIFHFGCPQEIISDNSTQLKSQQMTELRSLEINHRFTPVRTSQCNPVKNKSFHQNNDCNLWIKIIDARMNKSSRCNTAYNTARHEATEFTPACFYFFIFLYGRNPLWISWP